MSPKRATPRDSSLLKSARDSLDELDLGIQALRDELTAQLEHRRELLTHLEQLEAEEAVELELRQRLD